MLLVTGGACLRRPPPHHLGPLHLLVFLNTVNNITRHGASW
jgi:hypothetical protein